MLLMHTLLPEPVEPAISRCGIPLRSPTTGFPDMFLPTAKLIFDLELLNSFESIISLIFTAFILSFSTSMPTAALPGIGASILILLASRLRAISLESPTMLLTLTPGPGCISYLVTVGPGIASTTLASTLKLFNVSSSFLVFSARSVRSAPLPDGFLSRSIGGIMYFAAGLLLLNSLASRVAEAACAFDIFSGFLTSSAEASSSAKPLPSTKLVFSSGTSISICCSEILSFSSMLSL